ncbi:hypothetical protein [Salinibacterium sp. M195]|uniref:hypothetical protein n=1 Tax=Salinibacterium sp. M195 TaxID=2583374 RepID=UPI001C62F477|nr:hypothetical protein [Salinibacterium sp. M195]QYH36244.1 hypothetical protein FFT87_09915 [Salinibacterium sp. M195]
MSRPSMWMYLAAATCVLVMAGGCASASEIQLDNETITSSPSNMASNSVMSDTPALLEFDTGDETVLATSSNAGESIDVSPFTPTTGRIAVYSDCVGSGRITIAIGNVAEFSYDCRENADDAAHGDELDVDPSGSPSISVKTDNQELWTVTVVAVPPL